MHFFELALAAAQQPQVIICALCAALFINNHVLRILLLAALALAPALLRGDDPASSWPVFAAALALSYLAYLVRFLLSPPGSAPGRKKGMRLSARRLFPLFLLLLLPQSALADDNELDCVTTEWKALGANHKVCVSSYTDPRIPAVTCYISQARTGGIKGSFGLAEDPSNFALSCVRTGPVTVPDDLEKKETVFKESTNIFFKATRVTRLYDKEKGVLVYLAVSRHIIDGSPFNAVSVVPLR